MAFPSKHSSPATAPLWHRSHCCPFCPLTPGGHGKDAGFPAPGDARRRSGGCWSPAGRAGGRGTRRSSRSGRAGGWVPGGLRSRSRGRRVLGASRPGAPPWEGPAGRAGHLAQAETLRRGSPWVAAGWGRVGRPEALLSCRLVERRSLCIFPSPGDARPAIPRWWPSWVIAGLKAAASRYFAAVTLHHSGPGWPHLHRVGVQQSTQRIQDKGEGCAGCDVGTVAPAPPLRSPERGPESLLGPRSCTLARCLRGPQSTARGGGGCWEPGMLGQGPSGWARIMHRSSERQRCQGTHKAPLKPFQGLSWDLQYRTSGTSLPSNQTAWSV